MSSLGLGLKDDAQCRQRCGEMSTAKLAGGGVKGLTLWGNNFQMLVFCQIQTICHVGNAYMSIHHTVL